MPTIGWIKENNLDTIVVPTTERSFQENAQRARRWSNLRIAKRFIPQIKHIAFYQRRPISAITHVAPVQSIERDPDTDRYAIYLQDTPRQIRPILLAPNNRDVILQRPRYTSLALLENARSLNDVFNTPTQQDELNRQRDILAKVPSRVLIPAPNDVRRYLRRHDSLTEEVQFLCRTTVEMVQSSAEISLEVYVDPEIDDRYLTLYVRQEHFDPRTLNMIRNISANQVGWRQERLGTRAGKESPTAGRIVVTTDFAPKAG